MSQTLKDKAVKGLVWSSIDRFAAQSAGFIIGVFIARLLTPEDYGTVALLYVFIAVSEAFVDSGFTSALVRKTNRSETDKSTVFFFNLTVSIVVYFLLNLCSPLIAQFFNIPVLEQLTKLVAFVVVFNSLSIIQQTTLTARIDFKLQAKVTLPAVILSGLVGLYLAYRGYGVWALAIQMVLNSLIRTILLWIFVRWIPTQPFSKDSFKELFGYGSKLLASSLIDNLYKNMYALVIGKFFSPTDLGNYGRAKQYADFASSNITAVIQRVTFPLMCTIQDEKDRLRINYQKMLRLSAFVIFPLMLGLSALAKPVIITLLTDKWSAAIPLLQVICFSLMWYPIHAINLNLLQVKGRSDLFLRLEIIKKIIGVAVLCVTMPYGIMAMCYGRICSSMIILFVNTYYTGKLIDLGYIKQMADLLPTFIRSLLMWGLVWYVASLFDSGIIQLCVGTTVGVVFYFASAYLFKSEDFNNVLEILKKQK